MSNRFGLPEDAIAAARSIMSGAINEGVEQIDEGIPPKRMSLSDVKRAWSLNKVEGAGYKSLHFRGSRVHSIIIHDDGTSRIKWKNGNISPKYTPQELHHHLGRELNESTDSYSAAKDGYWVTDHMSKLTHAKPFRDSKEVEQIDELSKSTLKSYVKKATKSADKAWDKSEKEEDKAMATDGLKYPEKQQRHMDAAIKHTNVWRKRDSGIKVATKKLGEGVEQIDELSKGTLASYIKKATGVDPANPDYGYTGKGVNLKDIAVYQSNTDNNMFGKNFNQKISDKAERLKKNRESGVRAAITKLAKEEFEEDIFVLDEQFGVGAVLNYTDDTVTVVFEGHVEEYDTDDVALVEEVVDLQELSKETLRSYTAKAKADPAFEKKKGKPAKTTVAIRAKRTAGLENAKARLQAIVKKENEAHMEHAKKLNNKLDAHFESEAPKILAKHGYEKIHSGTFKDPYGEGKDAQINTYVKKHDNGHVTMFAMHKKGDTGSYGSSAHEAKATSTKGSSFSSHTPHYGVFDDKDYEKHMTDMMPKFEQHVIRVKEHGDNNSSW